MKHRWQHHRAEQPAVQEADAQRRDAGLVPQAHGRAAGHHLQRPARDVADRGAVRGASAGDGGGVQALELERGYLEALRRADDQLCQEPPEEPDLVPNGRLPHHRRPGAGLLRRGAGRGRRDAIGQSCAQRAAGLSSRRFLAYNTNLNLKRNNLAASFPPSLCLTPVNDASASPPSVLLCENEKYARRLVTF